MSENKDTALQKKERNITDEVLSRVSSLTQGKELVLPPNYSAENALKSAWLILQEVKDKSQNSVLVSCSKPSIANALLDMVIQGLNPAKKQCYFVAYGKQLQLMRSYMGTMMVTKRLSGIRDVRAECIYEGDEFEYEIVPHTGRKKIVKHIQGFDNIDLDKLRGAYAIVVMDNPADSFAEVMTMSQIQKAWNQGAAKGGSGAHKNFTDEMAKKTVINRACKLCANTSDDSDILVEAYNRSTENEYQVHSTSVADEYLEGNDMELLENVSQALFGEDDPFDPENPNAIVTGEEAKEMDGDADVADGR